MSFDLYLYPGGDQPPLDPERFLGALRGKLYTPSDDCVAYSNPDTGVEFTFTYYEGGAEAEGTDSKEHSQAFRARPHVHFNLNYFRPHTFGLEAGRVLSRFARALKLRQYDPQNGDERDAFDADAFLASYDKGNQGAHKALRALGVGGDVLSLPAQLNRALWDWNYNREEIADDFLSCDVIDVFVPRIMFSREDRRARSFCLFPNLIPTAVPKVDRVLITRDKLAGPFESLSRATPAWVRWEELCAAAAGFEVRATEPDDEDHPHLILYRDEEYVNQESAPEALARWVAALPDWPGRPDQIFPSKILDEELCNV